MSELRQDPVTGHSVIIAPERAKRPGQHGDGKKQTDHQPCPFCAGNEALTPPEVWALRENSSSADQPGWTVRVVPNKYPALEDKGASTAKNAGAYAFTSGLGAHELIIESAVHVVNVAMLNDGQFASVLRAYRDRMRALGDDPRWRYLLLYKNQGAQAGATLEHIHSQLIALPLIPPHASDEIDGAKRHYDATGRCIYCEMIRREIETGERLVARSENFIALCPFAPRFGYETWILPKNHAAAFEENMEEDLAALARVLKDFIVRLNRALDQPSFNYVIHSMPPRKSPAPHYHWHIEILPQLTKAAGFEWGSGMHLNPVAPEAAARLLRDAAL